MVSKKYMQREKKKARETAGFSGDELMVIQETFEFHDKDRSGELSFAECIQVLEDLGRVPGTIEQQQKLVKRMEQADEDGSGLFTLKEFLYLQRRFMDEDECMQYAKEKNAAEKSKFTDEEVVELREVYTQLCEDESETGTAEDVEFSFLMLRSLLRNLGVQLSAQQVHELKLIFKEHAIPSALTENGLQLIFADFLLLMGQLMADDFGGMRQASAKTAAMKEAERKQMEELMLQVEETQKRNSIRKSQALERSIERRKSSRELDKRKNSKDNSGVNSSTEKKESSLTAEQAPKEQQEQQAPKEQQEQQAAQTLD